MKRKILLAVMVLLLLSCNLPIGFTDGAEEMEPETEPEGGLEEGEGLLEPTAAILAWEAPQEIPEAPTPLNLPLRLVNTHDAPLSAPVTAGVPLPRALDIRQVDGLSLVNASGEAIPAQFTVLSRWGSAPDAQDAPVRWLLLDFQSELAPGEERYVFLQEGGEGGVGEPLVVEEDAQAVWVDTGAARFRIDKASGDLTEEGSAFHLTGRALGADGADYDAAAVYGVQVNLDGPQRASIEVRGGFTGDGSTLLDYTARYWFYAGQALVRLFYTVENNTPCPLEEYEQLACYDIGSPGSVSFDDLSLLLTTGLFGDLQFTVPGTEKLSGALDEGVQLYQDSSGSDHWDAYITWQDWEGRSLDTSPRMQSYVSWQGYRITQGDDVLQRGAQSEGWISLSSDEAHWGAGVRDFWQNFPKALRAQPGGVIQIALFPAEFGPEGFAFSLRAGEHKTHEIWLAPQADLSTYLTPLFAQAPPEWYVDSGAIGLMALPDWQEWPAHEQYIIDQLDTSPAHEGWDHVYDNLFNAIQRTDFYGIFDYGDWPIDYEGFRLAPLNPKYDFDYGMWLQWVRGGDPRWFDLAEAGNRHFADIDILHNLHEPRHWGDGIIFGHSYHDEDGFLNPHRNYGGASPDTAYGMRGMLLTYYLTGYEKAYQSALELADCIAYRISNDSSLCDYLSSGGCSGEGYVSFQDGLYDSNSRPVANSLSILTAAARATGDLRYLELADAIVDWIRPERQPFIDGPTGEEMYVKPWQLNMYLLALAGYLETLDELGRKDWFDAAGTYLALADWLHEYAWLPLDPLESGERAAYPYEWWFDGRQGDINDEYAQGNNIPSVNNWLLLGADVMAYAYHISAEVRYLDWGAQLFRTGSHDPFYEGDDSLYTETKQTVNSIAYGHIFLYEWAHR